MQTFLSKALIASVTIATVGLVAAPQAQALVFGGFGLNAVVNLDPAQTGPNDPLTPSPVTATFSDVTVDTASGDFVGSSFVELTNPTTFVFDRTEIGLNFYTLSAFSVELSGVTGADPFILTVNAQSGNFLRVANPQTSSVSNVFTLQAFDLDGQEYFGSFSMNDTQTGDGTASISFTAVPEPLTMLGASAAVAFGAAFKRRKANKG